MARLLSVLKVIIFGFYVRIIPSPYLWLAFVAVYHFVYVFIGLYSFSFGLFYISDFGSFIAYCSVLISLIIDGSTGMPSSKGCLISNLTSSYLNKELNFKCKYRLTVSNKRRLYVWFKIKAKLRIDMNFIQLTNVFII